jgi:hypothetical protein
MGRGNHTSPQVIKYPKRRDTHVKQLKLINHNNSVLNKLKNG